jgi:hypothetical protein
MHGSKGCGKGSEAACVLTKRKGIPKAIATAEGITAELTVLEE